MYLTTWAAGKLALGFLEMGTTFLTDPEKLVEGMADQWVFRYNQLKSEKLFPGVGASIMFLSDMIGTTQLLEGITRFDTRTGKKLNAVEAMERGVEGAQSVALMFMGAEGVAKGSFQKLTRAELKELSRLPLSAEAEAAAVAARTARTETLAQGLRALKEGGGRVQGEPVRVGDILGPESAPLVREPVGIAEGLRPAPVGATEIMQPGRPLAGSPVRDALSVPQLAPAPQPPPPRTALPTIIEPAPKLRPIQNMTELGPTIGQPPAPMTRRMRAYGRDVDLPHIRMVKLNYAKRHRSLYKQLREQFDGTVKPAFLRALAGNEASVRILKQAGLTDLDLAMMSDGLVPKGWEVHHKIPLDDLGTNAIDNLVLIEKSPSHTALSNAQRQLVGDLDVGQARIIEFPVPEGFVYPPRPGIVQLR
jgi:hypothetical protein